jgi:hypothetical protein
VSHVDLLEDVVLAMVVAWTTIAALYAGWRAGLTRRRSTVAKADGNFFPTERRVDVLGPVPFDDWTQRLTAEQARCARHGSSATVVALRVDERRGAAGQGHDRSVQDPAATATALTRRTRASDTICVRRDGSIRVLLVETTEIGARRFVDRISAELSTESQVSGNIVAAWAAVAPGRNLRAAERLAVARLRGAASGWLRSLAVHRTGEVAPDAEDLDLEGGSADAGRSVREAD